MVKNQHVSGLSSQSSQLENLIHLISPNQLVALAYTLLTVPDGEKHTKPLERFLILFLPFGFVCNTIHVYSKK